MKKSDELEERLDTLFSDTALPDTPDLEPAKIRKASSVQEPQSGKEEDVKATNQAAPLIAEQDSLKAPSSMTSGLSQRPAKNVEHTDLSNAKRNIGLRSQLGRSFFRNFLLAAILPALITLFFTLPYQNSASGSWIIIAIGGLAIIAVTSLPISFLLAHRMDRRIVQPISEIKQIAADMTRGNLNQLMEIDMGRKDEVNSLAQTFNNLASHFRTLVTNLENRLSSQTTLLHDTSTQLRTRTGQLKTSVQTSLTLAENASSQQLMQTTVDLIHNEMGFGHVSVFLLDETERWAIMRASNEQLQQQGITQAPRLAVGGKSAVGWTCARQQLRIVQASHSQITKPNVTLRPGIRSEIAVPLLVGDQLLGALDVQSTQEIEFDEKDIDTLHSLAGLIAVALVYERLAIESRRSTDHYELVSRIVNRLHRTNRLDEILALTVQELGEAFNLAEATIYLDAEGELQQDGNNLESLQETLSHNTES